ncbi:hypothetical protein K474DRAFT_938938 [Panus rudis PR-1116 ss-1]|nr:hypothetical protein K474DRAFT_938938 [Panus rudis PR-1116 ss-1]
MDFEHESLPPHWEACEHPEGKLYFRHATKNILTHSDVYDEEIRTSIETCSDRIRGLAPGRLPEDTEVVIELRRDQQGPLCFYYLASWSKRTIMWPEKTDILLLTGGARPVYDKAHLKHIVLTKFWKHVWMFPNHRVIYNGIVNFGGSSREQALVPTAREGAPPYISSQPSPFLVAAYKASERATQLLQNSALILCFLS